MQKAASASDGFLEKTGNDWFDRGKGLTSTTSGGVDDRSWKGSWKGSRTVPAISEAEVAKETWKCGICGQRGITDEACPTCLRPRGTQLRRSYMTTSEMTQTVVDALNGVESKTPSQIGASGGSVKGKRDVRRDQESGQDAEASFFPRSQASGTSGRNPKGVTWSSPGERDSSSTKQGTADTGAGVGAFMTSSGNNFGANRRSTFGGNTSFGFATASKAPPVPPFPSSLGHEQQGQSAWPVGGPTKARSQSVPFDDLRRATTNTQQRQGPSRSSKHVDPGPPPIPSQSQQPMSAGCAEQAPPSGVPQWLLTQTYQPSVKRTPSAPAQRMSKSQPQLQARGGGSGAAASMRGSSTVLGKGRTLGTGSPSEEMDVHALLKDNIARLEEAKIRLTGPMSQ
eukprot:TRINITY_DN14390_c0_g1_i6.p1 TRINITY_DN14390_c0_g1~~TRINITY_DN14390_c0_g1_i6.p1  ORF type:complete len:397 (+),score=69.78 TRINITY_DN14390_c0_g1_i6:156-1346(+)